MADEVGWKWDSFVIPSSLPKPLLIHAYQHPSTIEHPDEPISTDSHADLPLTRPVRFPRKLCKQSRNTPNTDISPPSTESSPSQQKQNRKKSIFTPITISTYHASQVPATGRSKAASPSLSHAMYVPSYVLDKAPLLTSAFWTSRNRALLGAIDHGERKQALIPYRLHHEVAVRTRSTHVQHADPLFLYFPTLPYLAHSSSREYDST